MASFLRGKQAGIQNDLSASILPHLFSPEEQERFGINSQISCMAYDPVQSLLAVGTSETKFGNGKIYVFGQIRVEKIIQPSRPTSFRDLQFCANRLVSLDIKSEIAIWDLDSGERIAGSSVAGGVACMLTDPMLDWAFAGLTNGEVVAYDLDRERLSPFRIPNFWKAKDPTIRGANLISMQLHPRDIGQMLIGYTYGAVIYSFKQNQPVKYFEYTVPPGAPGGNGESPDTLRKPRLTHALWHPTGTFVLTAHDDGSLVFWDPRDGRVVMARSLYDTKVDQPIPNSVRPKFLDPFTRISWCCKENPDDTGLLIAGGLLGDAPEKGLTFLDFGQTPVYQTSSWQVLSDHFKAKSQSLLETPQGAQVADYCLIPRLSPHFAGAQNPIAVLVLLTSGEMITLSFPSGYHISPTNQLHPSLVFVHPFVTRAAVSTLDRGRWLGMTEKRNQGEPLLKGGAEATKPRRRYEGRNILQVAHADGTVRIWDVGHGDEMENPYLLQVDIARALARYDNVNVSSMAMASNTGEFSVGTSNGEVIIYRWGGNKYFGQDHPVEPKSNPGGITDISSRTEPSLKEGLQPFALYEMMQGPITALQVSDVGFVAAGSEGGFFSIIDMRGPSIILQVSMAELSKPEKRSSFLGRHSSSASSSTKEYPVVIEFGVMTLEGDKYSSILCFVGTSQGKVATFKLLPSGGGYSAQLAGIAELKGRVVSINPIIADTGAPAGATGPTVSGLREGRQVNGTLVVVTQSEVRIFKPASAKGASKSFEDVFCDAAAVTEFELHGFALVGVFGDRTARAFSLPGLKEINKAPLNMLDASRSASNIVASTGDIFGWAGPSELVVLPVWGSGKGNENSKDKMINPDLAIPARPTISNFQWVSGTQYVSPTDLDVLIGGPDRPPSKRMLMAAAEESRRARGGGGAAGAAGGGGPSSPRAGTSQEGWGEYLTRQLNERTEKLNIMGDSMDNLQNQSQAWSDDVSKFVSKQKRNILLGSITGKF
ncbi:uncharacterized protein E0L32_002742 [Thyridium curvatum]|uniref:Lethal giant larvae (Lgl)-like C-terminal domain-containing protein n=1 Tax=Thyridium curvatum TaxID=1093900 RepID=A0A507BFG3_9PEZI|nr:uncharacterized protein E0L32_002742 [Thyridium curvatum]TPX18233.1 hypothetical protein E0L32_002742 [Thyridium curvatum]